MRGIAWRLAFLAVPSEHERERERVRYTFLIVINFCNKFRNYFSKHTGVYVLINSRRRIKDRFARGFAELQ